MTNRSKQKGTAFETAVVEVLREGGFPHAERRALHGNVDRGDIAGVPGWTIECKNTKALSLGEHLDEAQTESVNAGTRNYALVSKRRMKHAREAFATVPLRILVELIANDRRNPAAHAAADDFLERTKDIA